MKRTVLAIIAIFSIFAHSVSAQNNIPPDADVSIKFYDRTMYYPGEVESNPVYIHVTVANNGSDTLRFKLADDRMFSIDFSVFNVRNSRLSDTEALTRKRTTNRTVYFREISLEPGESYSFVENLKHYVQIDNPSVYYVEMNFYPELYRNKTNYVSSNRLSLEIRPSPSAAASTAIPVQASSAAVLRPEEIGPDKVVEQTIIARQKSLWDQFFLYINLEEILKRDPSRSRRYNNVSADERERMIASYKADLMQQRIDHDIVATPSRFEIETTMYSKTDGSVKVLEWFDNNTFTEKKRYTYYVRQRDGIWEIYDYTVDNLGTE